jgi:hypothetical protein
VSKGWCLLLTSRPATLTSCGAPGMTLLRGLGLEISKVRLSNSLTQRASKAQRMMDTFCSQRIDGGILLLDVPTCAPTQGDKQ